MIAVPPTISVGRRLITLAEMVTGPSTSSANGLFRPPVRYSRNASCSRSNMTMKKFSLSDRRLFSGKTNIAIRLPIAEIPTAR